MTFINLLISYNKLKIMLTMILSEKREVSHCINWLPKAGMQIWQLEIIWNWVLKDWCFYSSILFAFSACPLTTCLLPLTFEP